MTSKNSLVFIATCVVALFIGFTASVAVAQTAPTTTTTTAVTNTVNSYNQTKQATAYIKKPKMFDLVAKYAFNPDGTVSTSNNPLMPGDVLTWAVEIDIVSATGSQEIVEDMPGGTTFKAVFFQQGAATKADGSFIGKSASSSGIQPSQSTSTYVKVMIDAGVTGGYTGKATVIFEANVPMQ